jgi:beta-N-acetylhexosaminidase
MTIEEQIGQVLVVGFDGTTPTTGIIDLIERYHVGGIVLFSRNIQDAGQVRTLTRQLQMTAKAAGHRYPLLITLDQENGMVRRLGQGATTFPGNMALGAIGSEALAHDVALATGRELKELGINMNLAPVVDVNNNPGNPVIGVRSFGEDPQLVARLGSAMVKGYQEAGIISCLKHFPGHGDTATDSHLSLPIIPHTLERLEEIELVPFRRAIAAGADSVMIAHVYFSALMQGEVLPSTVSPAIINGLLRQHLGFTGVIMTDCLEMSAVAETIGVAPGSVMALQAGADLILISHRYDQQQASTEAIKTAVENNILSPQLLQQAAERVAHLKERFLSWDDIDDTSEATATTWLHSPQHEQLSKQAYALSTTLVRNTANVLPLQLTPEQRIVVIYPQRDAFTMVEDRSYPHDFLIESLRQRHTQVQALPIILNQENHDDIYQAASAADVIIAVTVNANLDLQQSIVMNKLLQSGRPIIGIAAYNPYDLLAFPELATYLVTYEYTEPAISAAVRVIFGGQAAQGHLPVTIPLDA